MRTHSDRARVKVVALAILLALWLARAPGLAAGLAYLGPGMFIFLLLWFGRYPGEKAIRAFIGRTRLRRARESRARRSPLRVRLPRGGALLATALAGRAPPLRMRLH